MYERKYYERDKYQERQEKHKIDDVEYMLSKPDWIKRIQAYLKDYYG